MCHSAVGLDVNDANGVIKSATNSTIYYLMQVTNTGNITDKFNLTVANIPCPGHDFDPLTASMVDFNGNVITNTGWIAPNATFQFLLKLVAPTGTNPFKWSCHDVTATSVHCPGTTAVGHVQTEILGSPNTPLVNISKVGSKDPVQSGDTLVYTIYAFNSNDKYDALNFVVNETYASNVTFLSAVPSPTSGNNTWSFGTLGYGPANAKTIRIKVLVNNGNNCSGTIVNTVTASSTNTPSITPASVTTTIQAYPDLSIVKTARPNPNPAEKGGYITYTLAYSNIGTCEATNVLIRDLFDDVHTNMSNHGTGTVNPIPGNEITWNLGRLYPGHQIQFPIQYRLIPISHSLRKV